MTNKRSSIGNFLESQKLMFQNAKDDEEIRTLLVPFRVDESQFEQALSLCSQGYKLENLQIKLHGQQYRAYKKLEKLIDQANENYQIHLKFLRISYEKEPTKLKELSAYGIRSANIADWIKQAFAFYQTTVVDEEAMAELDSFGITAEMVQQSEAKITEVEAGYRAHKIKLGAAQNAITQRDEVFKELAAIARRFRAICRTALKDHPQLLEKLGIKVYTEGYVRAKPKKKEEQPPADGGTSQSTQPAANAGVVENEGSPVELAAVETASTKNKKKKINS